MPVASTWLTASRMRRLGDVLESIPERGTGLPVQDAPLRIWRVVGGPMDEIEPLVEVLVQGELLRLEAGRLRITSAGRRLSARNPADRGRHLALALIRAGLFHDQARRFLESFPADETGGVTCRLADARREAPQLAGALQLWPDVRDGAILRVPESLVGELATVWALLGPPGDERFELDRRRKTIGNRAEAYTYHLERVLAATPSSIVWVAREDDRLGYDVEDRTAETRRMIEVKGSGGPEVTFFMSAHEWDMAHEHPDHYEVQFWGRIDLNRPVDDEYLALRALGFPVVLQDLPELSRVGGLVAKPDRWKVHVPRPASEMADDVYDA